MVEFQVARTGEVVIIQAKRSDGKFLAMTVQVSFLEAMSARAELGYLGRTQG